MKRRIKRQKGVMFLRFSFRSLRLVQTSDEGSMPKTVSVNQYARNQDKYTMPFEDASQHMFSEFQLKGMEPVA
jgi:hypothetical protein